MEIIQTIKNKIGENLKFTVLLGCLSLWGCLAIYNSTFFSHHPFLSSGKQIIWLVISLLALLTFASIPAGKIHQINKFASPIVVLALWIVLIYGITVNGMHGWFEFGPVFLQPSEIAKPFFIITLCSIISCRQNGNCIKNDLLFFTIASMWLLPIALQPDYGTLSVYCGTMLIIYWSMGGSMRTLLKSGIVLAIAAIGIIISRPYVWNRFKAFLSPESDPYNSGWHILQYRRAMAHGGLWGSSWGNNSFTEMYLPNPEHDSIFASLGEAVGFFGLIPVFLIISIILYLCFIKAWKVNNRKYSSVIIGITSILCFQTLLHISVTVGIFPPTGITLPLLSYGGSSLLATMISFGIIISFIKQPSSDYIGAKKPTT